MKTLLMKTRLIELLSRFSRHKRGNIAMVVAIVSLPLTLAMGMGVDYTLASYRQDQINGFADSATLSAVTPSMMATESAYQAQTQAQQMFLSQLAQVPNVSYANANVVVTASDSTGSAVVTRTVHLSYTVASNNIFSTLLGMNSIALTGVSTSTSSTAPNINFYMLLDDSPSMAIAATSSGIATMVAATPAQGGCAFACHESDPAADNLGNPTCPSGNAYCTAGQPEDNFTVARNLGVALRIDNVNASMQNLLSSANTTEAQYNTTYKFALYTMDYNLNVVGSYGTPSTLSQSQINALNISQLEVYNNGCLTPTNCNNDTDSHLDQNLSALNLMMPTPGNGTNNSGDTAQEVMFIVSDGVDDYYQGTTRVMAPIDELFAYCAAVKARNIRIAFLYLTYNPLPTNSFYNSNIAPFQPNIATEAQNCASAGLYFQVSTDGDITAAMTTLFQRAVTTARLSQ